METTTKPAPEPGTDPRCSSCNHPLSGALGPFLRGDGRRRGWCVRCGDFMEPKPSPSPPRLVATAPDLVVGPVPSANRPRDLWTERARGVVCTWLNRWGILCLDLVEPAAGLMRIDPGSGRVSPLGCPPLESDDATTRHYPGPLPDDVAGLARALFVVIPRLHAYRAPTFAVPSRNTPDLGAELARSGWPIDDPEDAIAAWLDAVGILYADDDARRPRLVCDDRARLEDSERDLAGVLLYVFADLNASRRAVLAGLVLTDDLDGGERADALAPDDAPRRLAGLDAARHLARVWRGVFEDSPSRVLDAFAAVLLDGATIDPADWPVTP